jgi:hypothetical protein
MAKKEIKAITKDSGSKGFWERSCTPRKIEASRSYGTSREGVSAFGGLLGLIKFLDLLRLEEGRRLQNVPNILLVMIRK